MVSPPQRSIPRDYRPRRLFFRAPRTDPYSRPTPASSARPSSSASFHGARLSGDPDSSPTYVQPSSPECSPEPNPKSSSDSIPDSSPEECPECFSTVLSLIDLMRTVNRIVSRAREYNNRRQHIATLILLVDAYRAFTLRHAL